MKTYDIRMLDDIDNINDLKRYMNMFIIFSGGAVNDFGGDGKASTFIKENPDIFNPVSPIMPDNIPSSGRWLLQDIVELSTFQIVWKNIKRLFE